MDFIKNLKANAPILLGLISTMSLVSIAFSLNSLSPLAKWSKIQNECIERTIAFQGIPDRVWSCNGGGN